MYFISLSSLSKKVKLSGIVTEDKMTGERYVTQVTVMEETMGQQETKQTNSQSTTQGKEQYVICCFYISVFVRNNKGGGF